MRRTNHRVHDWAPAYGDAASDPWPGDYSRAGLMYGVLYRFDGQVWRDAGPRQGPAK